MDQQANGLTLREYFSMLYRRKFAVLAVFVITTATVAAGAYLVPPVFTASTTLIVKFGREFFYRPEVGSLESSRVFSLAEMVNSEVAILSSRDLAQEVVEELGVETLYPDILDDPLDPDIVLAKAVLTFQDQISINAVFDSSVITVSFEHRDPRTAAEALNILIERFKDKHLEIFSESTSKFLQTQLEKYRQNLAKAENALQAFKGENRIYQLPGQKDAIVQQRQELQTELRGARFRISEIEKQLEAFKDETNDGIEAVPSPAFSRQRAVFISRRSELNSVLQDSDARIAELTQNLARFTKRRGKSDKTVPPHPGVEQFRSLDEAQIRLLDLELKYLDLRRNYNKESREVATVKNEILLVKRFLKSHGKYVKEVLETGIRDELSSLQARRKTLLGQIARIDSDLRTLLARERALQIQTISTEHAALEFKRDSLVAGITALDREISALSTKEKVLRQLERQVTVSERSYQTYLEKYEEAKTTEELDAQKIVNIGVIEKAAPPVGPTGLSRKMKIALGAFVGLLAGIAAAFFIELLGF